MRRPWMISCLANAPTQCARRLETQQDRRNCLLFREFQFDFAYRFAHCLSQFIQSEIENLDPSAAGEVPGVDGEHPNVPKGDAARSD